MKKSITQTRKKTLDLDSADPMAAGNVDSSGAVEAGHGQDVAELVWTHFGQEISDALREVQQALAPEQSGIGR